MDDFCDDCGAFQLEGTDHCDCGCGMNICEDCWHEHGASGVGYVDDNDDYDDDELIED